MSRSVWATRRERAAQLLRRAPHAEEILVFYIRLTEIQERVAQRVPVGDWLHAVGPTGDGPALRLEPMPEDDLHSLFEGFLRETLEVGTDVVVEGARALLDGHENPRNALAAAAGFHARAFLEPIWTTLADALGREHKAFPPGRCPMCESAPVASVLRDLPDALGARGLVCPLCATEWRIDRLRCAACGETSPEALCVHTAESVPWVRVEECLTCRRYLKAIDLRERGDAVPIVDELATVELDVWARERRLAKLRTNVLEL